MNNFESKVITMIYDKNKNNDTQLRIFGAKFVENNKKICRIMYNNENYELKEYFENIPNGNNDENLIEIKLIIPDSIINISSMFQECHALISISSEVKLKDSNTIYLKEIEISKSFDIPDISFSSITSISYSESFNPEEKDNSFQNFITLKKI